MLITGVGGKKQKRVSTGGEKHEQTPRTKGPSLLAAPARRYVHRSLAGGQGLTGPCGREPGCGDGMDAIGSLTERDQQGCAELCYAKARSSCDGRR